MVGFGIDPNHRQSLGFERFWEKIFETLTLKFQSGQQGVRSLLPFANCKLFDMARLVRLARSE